VNADPPGLNLPRLLPWFRENVAPVSSLRATLVGRGLSNLTYKVSSEDHVWALRRPPLAHVLPTAHDMWREYRVQKALEASAVPVPKTVAYCGDESVIGAPFYVMEFVEGIPPGDSPDFVERLDLEARRNLSRRLIEVLAALHQIDYRGIGLEDFGHPQGYMARQVKRFGQQLERSRNRPVEDMDFLFQRLSQAVPERGDYSIVHGDYRLDNCLLDSSGDIAAVLDWELSTLGDPLADLGMLAMYWADPGEDLFANAPGVESALLTSLDGFMRRHEALAYYSELTGRSLESLPFYEAFAHFKLAVILEGIHKRYIDGGTVGEGFEKVGDLALAVAAKGREIAEAARL
jgi:aminoglycoside phosphotransferase (APT) family kinase protein